jgi:hypothetical protein
VVNSGKATANLILEDVKSVLASSAAKTAEVSYA